MELKYKEYKKNNKIHRVVIGDKGAVSLHPINKIHARRICDELLLVFHVPTTGHGYDKCEYLSQRTCDTDITAIKLPGESFDFKGFLSDEYQSHFEE